MKRILTIFIILIGTAIGPAFFSFKTAGAYSTSPNPPNPKSGNAAVTAPAASGSVFENLLSPFQNFFRSVNPMGNISPPVRVGPPSGFPSVVPPAASTGARSAFERFDNWLYGIIGFHISDLLAVILSILSWLLGLVKSIVDWLLGLFR